MDQLGALRAGVRQALSELAMTSVTSAAGLVALNQQLALMGTTSFVPLETALRARRGAVAADRD